MIYPDNFERKIGFAEVRTLLKGRCMSSLGTEWVDHHVTFSSDFDTVRESLAQAQEFARFMATEEDVYEENFYDVRQPLMRIRPERTYLEELDLFDLKRSLQTVVSLVRFLRASQEEEVADEETQTDAPTGSSSSAGATPLYPALTRMISRRSAALSSRMRLLASTTAAGSMKTVLPVALSSWMIPLILRLRAGATGMTRRPSRSVGETSRSM